MDTAGSQMPLLDHIEELRKMVFKMLLAVAVGMTLSFLFRAQVASFVQSPLAMANPLATANLQSLGVADSMTISLKLSFYAGLVLAFPALLYFLSQFLFPGLNRRERRLVLKVTLVGFVLFLAGIWFGFFIVLPAALEFFFNDAKMMQWVPTWTVGEYYSFATRLVLAFGLSFELPVVVLSLVKIGILSPNKMKTTRPHAVVVIAVFSAIMTPTSDIFTLLLMTAPMFLLYESCIWLASWQGAPPPVPPIESSPSPPPRVAD